MKFIPTGPGRLSPTPVFEPGDSLSLCDGRGIPVGVWVPVAHGTMWLSLRVPPGAPPIRHILGRDNTGRIQWWSLPLWGKPAQPGDTVWYPTPPEPWIERARTERPSPTPTPPQDAAPGPMAPPRATATAAVAAVAAGVAAAPVAVPVTEGAPNPAPRPGPLPVPPPAMDGRHARSVVYSTASPA